MNVVYLSNFVKFALFYDLALLITLPPLKYETNDNALTAVDALKSTQILYSQNFVQAVETRAIPIICPIANENNENRTITTELNKR